MRDGFARYAVAFAALLSLQCEPEASVALNSAAATAAEASARVLRIGDVADPINHFTLDSPSDSAVLPPSFDVFCAVRVDGEASFNRKYRGATLCVELDGAVARCAPVMQSNLRLEGVAVGNHTASAFIAIGATAHRQTPPVSFSVVAFEDVAAHADRVAKRLQREHSVAVDQDVLGWAQSARDGSTPALTSLIGIGSSTPTLLIGVKTALRTDFHLRQAIRETWASSRSLPSDVRVVFLGCRLLMDSADDLRDRSRLRGAIDLEKRVFGDLLTDELDCDDSYADLPAKVAEFMRWGVEHFGSSLSHVMIADDDIYLRTDAFMRRLHLLPQRRLYAGQVWSKTFNRPGYAMRDTRSRYRLSEEIYPMKMLPPFAFGPHFVLSIDCARFIAKNSRRLRGLAGMDDISVALWMFALQVHPQHIERLWNLRASACRNDLVSFADLSSLAIRVIHSNLKAGRAFCTDFDSTVWKKTDPQRHIETVTEQLELTSSLRDIRLSRVVQVITSVNGIDFLFTPSIETLADYSDRVYKHLKQARPSTSLTFVQAANQLVRHHRSFYTRTKETGALDDSRTELWRHNLFIADPESPTVYIGYSSAASYSHTLFECLFAAIYPSSPVLVARVETLAEMHDARPSVPVFSILDPDCPSGPRCPVRTLTHAGSDMNPGGKAIMFSGESWETGRLLDDVVLISTVSNAPQANRHVYISMASASFAERLNHSPLDLLSPWTARKKVESTASGASTRRFCAFLYSQCDWPHRQYFYDVLNSVEPVDAIGKCAGSSKAHERPHKLTSRRSRWYLDDAVTQYEQFKFVIAFENSIAPGYLTEKAVNAFLAGAIPIFWGNSTSLAGVFNPRSYIDCGAFSTLRQCAAHVLEVHQSAEEYERMRREPPIIDLDAFNEAFSWHPAVPSNTSASAVATYLFG